MKKIIVVVLSVLLIISTFSACFKNKESISSENEDKITGIATEKPKKQIDIKRTELRFACFPIAPILAPKGTNSLVDMQYEKIDMIKNKYNVDINLDNTTLPSDFNAYFTEIESSLAAGACTRDVLYFSGVHIKTFMDKGYLLPLNEFESINLYDNNKWDTTIYENLTKSGKIYGFVDRFLFKDIYNDLFICDMIIWNRDMLESKGIDNLNSLVKNRQWTWDKLLEIAMALTEDNNGDNNPDIYGAAGVGYPELYLANSNNANLAFYDNEKVICNLNSPDVAESILFYRDLCSKYNVCKDMGFISQAYGDLLTLYMEGNAGMVFGNNAAAALLQYSANDSLFTLYPIGPKGTDYTYSGFSFNDSRLYAIPESVENPEELIFLMDVLCEPIDREELKPIIRDPFSVQKMTSLTDSPSQDKSFTLDDESMEPVYNAFFDPGKKDVFFAMPLNEKTYNYFLVRQNILDSSFNFEETLNNCANTIQEGLDEYYAEIK